MTAFRLAFGSLVTALCVLMTLPAWGIEPPATQLETAPTPSPQNRPSIHGKITHVVVIAGEALVYQEPNPMSNIVRRVYRGEVVEVKEKFKGTGERLWVLVALGTHVEGYVDASLVEGAENLDPKVWAPEKIIREERPMGISIRTMGETFGAALNARLHLFSQLAISLTGGSVIDKSAMQGTALAIGIQGFLTNWQFTPTIEAGLSRLSYHKDQSTLRITTLYVTAGLEWMSEWGGFAQVGLTYMRGLEAEISFEFEPAREQGNLDVPKSYGILDPGDDFTFQELRPIFSIGYAL